LKRLMSDPETAQLARALLSINGSSDAKANKITNANDIETWLPPKHRTLYEDSSQIDAVRRAVSQLDGTFRVSGVADQIRRNGVTLTNGGVSRSLKRMAVTGELVIVKSIRGSSGSIYGKGEKFREVK
jgi:hypothetical protein